MAEVVEEIKTKVIGKTYSDNGLLKKSGEFRDKTEVIISHYYDSIINRFIEIISKLNKDWLPYWLNNESYTDYFDYHYELVNRYSDHKYGFTLRINHTKSGHCIASINMSESGNCCGSMFVHDISTCLDVTTHKDLGKLLLAMVEDIAIVQRNSQILGIHIASRTFTKALVEQFGWTKIDEFINRNSGNDCWVMSKKLSNEFNEKEILGKEL